MSELDQTIEELEAEVLAELEEANGADAPKNGAVASQKPTLKNKAKDLGGAEPEDSESEAEEGRKIGKKTGAKKASAPKTKPSNASPKTEAAHDDEEEDEEEDDKEDKEEVKKKKKEDEEEEAEKAEEEVEFDDEVAEVVEMHIQNIDITADVEALVAGEDLSEEFMEKAATIFEAAVKSKTREEVTRIVEEQQFAIAEEVHDYKEALAEKVDQYLDYVVEEWMKENELAIERGLKGEIAEDFISGLKQLFEDHYIDVPDERYDVLEAQSDKIAELEEQLNSVMENNIQMNSVNSELVREQVILEVASDLTDTEIEKFASLVEDVDFGDEDGFRAKLDTLKESYFPRNEYLEETFIHDEDDYGSAAQDIDTSDTMQKYMSAIGRVETRINGR